MSDRVLNPDLAAILRRGNKYHAVPTFYAGSRYDSKLEAAYAQALDVMLRTGGIRAWERQVPVPLHALDGSVLKVWRCDFLVTYPNGALDYVECKGHPTREWKLTRKLFEAEYPERTLVVVTR